MDCLIREKKSITIDGFRGGGNLDGEWCGFGTGGVGLRASGVGLRVIGGGLGVVGVELMVIGVGLGVSGLGPSWR
ncbi:hypothetical protein TWF481_002587 [Arthrobotrys musiformis]|uniref:Uncharacterized protein n=1 Tax=Arthrobotrys musiformis TaxID=47236 RepID=A0AAV9VRP6_9PEZI